METQHGCSGIIKRSSTIPESNMDATTKPVMQDETFALQMLDHLDEHGDEGCRNMRELCHNFMSRNPQWGGSVGQSCMEELCSFTNGGGQRGTTTCSGAKMQGLQRLKKICCNRIVQHGGGHTDEDRRKTEAATSVLKNCCALQGRYQVGRGSPPGSEEDLSTKDTEENIAEDEVEDSDLTNGDESDTVQDTESEEEDRSGEST